MRANRTKSRRSMDVTYLTSEAEGLFHEGTDQKRRALSGEFIFERAGEKVGRAFDPGRT
ncbi:hypothetical protein GCM10023075_83790 [Streptosporangium album]